MGIKISLNSRKGAGQIAEIMRSRTKSLMKMATVEFFRQAIISTPVDTGRARFGGYCTVGTPSNEVPPYAPKGWKSNHGQNPYFSVQNIAERTELPSFTITDTLYIANNVEYIVPLNNGRSKQAPARFVERAAARVQNGIARMARSIR